jgi:murein tripeptide amidase MpaA
MTIRANRVLLGFTLLLVTIPGGLWAKNSADDECERVIGRSVQGRPLRAFTIGSGSRSVVFVGGIHGGYEWNSIVLAREIRDHFRANPELLAEDLSLSIIPAMNPDGLARVTGGRPVDEVDLASLNTVPGRFNARGVDLNRNWGSEDWQPTSYWGRRQVDAGKEFQR